MSFFSNFMNFISGKSQNGEAEITKRDLEEFVDKNKMAELSTYNLALQTGIAMIADCILQCEFKTYENWKEIKGEQYYKWNYAPNMNKNAPQFFYKLVWMLIYRQECLVIQTRKGDFLIADSYVHEEYALKQDEFSNVVVNPESGMGSPYTFPQTFRMDEVLFYRLQNLNLKNLLDSLMDEYAKLLETAVQKYHKSGGERGVLTIDANAATGNYGTKADGTPRTFNDVYADLLKNQFSKYFKSQNAVIPLFKGFNYTGSEQKGYARSEFQDVTDITKEIYERVGNALNIPAPVLRGDVAGVKEATRNMFTFSVNPILTEIETENNKKLYGQEVLNGNMQKVDRSAMQYMTQAEVAGSADKMIGCGGWSIDEVRTKAGDVPLNTEWSRRHCLTKNYQFFDVTTGIALPDGNMNTNTE